nr:ABC transporter substrate-binding protein [Acidobacteriota bacterium]
GLGNDVVGVSHECDFPVEARKKRAVIHSRIPAGATAGEIDKLVREYVERGESVYSVDVQALREIVPDLIVTQDLCHVCAASPDDLAGALAGLEKHPSVLSLNPQKLEDVWRDILVVGRETSRGELAEQLMKGIRERLEAVRKSVEKIAERPRVVFLEWLEPLYVGGHWTPEMIPLAGGEDVFGRARKASFRIDAQEVIDVAPEIIVVAPCGYGAEQARAEYSAMKFSEGWNAMPAVRSGRVYAFEANSYSSRPGPRLVTGIEALAKMFHPAIEIGDESARAFVPVQVSATAKA